MNIEPASISMGFFAVYTESYKLTASKKSLFSQIPLTIPFNGVYIFFSIIIHTDIFQETEESSGQIPYDIILMLFFIILLTSIIMSTIACFYSSEDMTYKKVIGVLRQCCGRLIFIFFWAFVMGAIYTPMALSSLVWFLRGMVDLRLLDPHFTGLNYMLVVLNVAIAVTGLEKDYGIKDLAKSMRLVSGKMWISYAVYGLLEIAFTGIILPFCYMVIFGNNMYLVGRYFLRIGCSLFILIWIHFSLVRLTVVYLVCKSNTNQEDILTAAHAAAAPVMYLIWLMIKTFN